MPTPEERVRKLARAPGNTECPNCGQVKQFGFGTICIKFYTFVCNECKTSHQAISHRCKSISMSSWTAAEVDELERRGNNVCRDTWLQNAPPIGQGGRPAKGMPIDVFKRFVLDAYEHKRYYGQGSAPVSRPVPVAAPAAAPVITPRQSAAPAAPVADLLDFGGGGQSAPAPAASTNSNINAFAADFSSFASAPASSSFATDFASAPAPANNDFADFAVAAAPSSFAFMNSSSDSAPAKKPIMNSSSSSAVAISSMGGGNMGFASQNGNMAGNSMMQQQKMNNPAMGNPGMMGMGMPAGFGAFGGNNNNMVMNGGMMNNQNGMTNGMNGGMMNNGMMNQNGMMNGMNGGMMNNGMMNQNRGVMNGMTPNSFAPMSFGGTSGNAISNMQRNVQQQTQNKRDAFSDLLPF